MYSSMEYLHWGNPYKKAKISRLILCHISSWVQLIQKIHFFRKKMQSFIKKFECESES